MSSLHITSQTLNKHKMGIDEAIVLLAFYYNVDMNNVFSKLTSKSLVSKKFFQNKPTDEYFMTDAGISAIEDLLLDSEKTMPNDEKIINLAKNMQSLYPEGKKQGTNFYWRGNLPDIIKKLKKFFKKYGSEYSDEQILGATVKYLHSFRNSNTYMQLLRYFIIKNTSNTGGDEVSELMNYIENAGAIEGALDVDWTQKVV